MMPRHLKVILLFLCCLVLSACAGGSGSSSSTGTTEVTVAMQLPAASKPVFKVITSSSFLFQNYTSRSKIPSGVASFTITTSGGDFNPIVVNVASSGTLFPVRLTVPNGKDRTILVEGKDNAGTVIYTGKELIPSLDGTPLVVSLKVTYALGVSKTYGGPKLDSASTGKQTKDGGFFLAGQTKSFGSYSSSGWGLRVKSNGNILWQKAYSPSAAIAAQGYSNVAMFGNETADGGFFVAGSASNNANTLSHTLAMKLDQQGAPTWTRLFAGPGVAAGATNFDNANSYGFTSDGGYIIAANTSAFSAAQGADFWFLKLAADGTLEWNATVGGTSSDTNPSVEQVSGSAGDYVAAGLANDPGSPAVAIFKFTSGGLSATPKLYAKTGMTPNSRPRMHGTSDGGFIVAVTTFGASPGIWVLKFDRNLALLWEKFFSGNIAVGAVGKTADGGAVIGGNSGSDLLAFKLDASGNVAWSNTYAKPSSNTMRGIHENSDGSFLLTGQNVSPQGDPDIWLIRTNSSGAVPGVTTPVGLAVDLIRVSPTPGLNQSTWTTVTWATPALNQVTVTSPALAVTSTNSVPTDY